MRARLAGFLLLGLLPVACVTPPPAYHIDAPGLHIAIGGDMDVWALNMAQWGFADASRLHGRPFIAARAAAALEHLAAQQETPRWAGMSPITKMEILTARAALRQALGIAPDAPSGPVIAALLAAAAALHGGDSAAAAGVLGAPFFTFGVERTVAILTAMPFLRAANIATMHAGMHNSGPGGAYWSR